MNEINYQYTSGILLDRCPRGHGIWLDAQELERAQVFAERWDQVEGLAAKYQKALASAAEAPAREPAATPAARRSSRVGRFLRLVTVRPFA